MSTSSLTRQDIERIRDAEALAREQSLSERDMEKGGTPETKSRYALSPAITVEDSPAGPVTVVKMRPALTERDMEKGGAD